MKPHELTIKRIADELLLSVGDLCILARRADEQYLPRKKIWVNGKLRDIDPPKEYFKNKMRTLHRFFQKHFPPTKWVHGGAKGRSCFTNARIHLAKKYILTRDIKDCYPSIKADNLCLVLNQIGFSKPVSKLLSPLNNPLSGMAFASYNGA